MSWLDSVAFDSAGLVPVIAQETDTGELLMLAYANRQALERTLETGQAHYWSRSRNALWRKGETSGNLQEVGEIRVDCDGDAVLYRVRQTGPACHTLQRSCFFRRVRDGELEEAGTPGHILAAVDLVVAERQASPRDGSYTSYLFAQGTDKILKKLGEEATEVVIAAKNATPEELAAEAADLLFHLVVLLRARNLPMETVWKELGTRFGRVPRELPNPDKRTS
jgi:phosphoribosyl-ATP pyrophosphohydrolase/phosphoribosyl-AMP cyclohydrolase